MSNSPCLNHRSQSRELAKYLQRICSAIGGQGISPGFLQGIGVQYRLLHTKTGFPTNSAETCFCLQPAESALLAELSAAAQWFFCLEEATAYSPTLQPGDFRRTQSNAVKR